MMLLWMRLAVLMLMMRVLSLRTMMILIMILMMILMMILNDDTNDDTDDDTDDGGCGNLYAIKVPRG